jgi:hypothetical protein
MTLAAAKYNLPMNTDELLAGIDKEIARLEEVRRTTVPPLVLGDSYRRLR